MRGLPAALLIIAASVVGAQQGPQDSVSRVVSQPFLQASIGGGFARASASPVSTGVHGFSLQAALAIRTPLQPLRFRVDGSLSDAGSTRVSAFTAGVMLSAPARWNVAPFLMAGGGGYAQKGASLTSGWNLGLGVNLRAGSQTLFMESRVHAYRDRLAGQRWVVPNGVVSARHEAYTYLWHPLSFGFRF
jgi:hypothetical protein